MAKTFTYEVMKHIGTIAESGSMTTELNVVSFNGAEPKHDLRRWRVINGERKMQKGLTFSAEELAALRDLLNSMEDING